MSVKFNRIVNAKAFFNCKAIIYYVFIIFVYKKWLFNKKLFFV